MRRSLSCNCNMVILSVFKYFLKVVKFILIPQFRYNEYLAFSSYISTAPKIQRSAKDFENEKMDRQSMQHQLHKVLKELRKARDQIANLEAAVSVSVLHNHTSLRNTTSVNSSYLTSTLSELIMRMIVRKCFVFQKQSSARFSEPNSYNKLEFERLTIDDPTSPSKLTNLLDESFLECPKCHAPYPTSRHRELLAHIDYCFA